MTTPTPSRTYEAIKAEVDLANPTPPLVWHLYTDNPAHEHDDHAVARADMDFAGERYILEAHVLGYSHPPSWHGRIVGNELEMRMPADRASYQTWALTKAAMATAWEGIADRARGVMALATHATEQLVADGVGAPPALSSDATLASLTGNGVSFTFTPGTFRYSSSTTSRQIVLTAAPTHAAATVAFTYFSGRPVVGQSTQLLFDTRVGENQVIVEVTAEDGTQQQYTFSITRAR